MSSYGLLARLSAIEGDADDLQATLGALLRTNNLNNANVEGGHALKVGPVLKKVDKSDTMLTVEGTSNIIKFGVNTDEIQEKLEQAAAPANETTTSQALLDGAIVKRVSAKDNTLSVETADNVIKFGVNTDEIQEKLEQAPGPANETTT